MGLIIKIISFSDGQRGCSRSKAHGTFPSGVPNLQRRHDRVDKRLESVHLWGWASQLPIASHYQDNRVSPCLLPQWLWFTSWLFPKPTYVLFSSSFSGLCLCMSVSVSRFLTLAIKENLFRNTRSLPLSKCIRIWMLIYNLLHPATSAFEL